MERPRPSCTVFPRTAVFIESTANGVTGLFADLWRGACEGTNGFIPVFIPWFTEPDYRESVPSSFERTPEEDELVSQYGLDDEQLMFRRRKIAQNGASTDSSKNIQQILTKPSLVPDGLSSIQSSCRSCLLKPRDVEQRLALEGDEFVNNPRGELTTYRPHDPGERYVIGADSSMGIRNGDYSVAQVLDSKKRQVATWRGHVHPDYYAEVLQALGEYYNQAFIIVENNSHGILTCTRLGKDFAYPNMYLETQVDKLTDRETIKLGFTTTSKTKPLVIDQLRASLREGEMELNDKTTIRELMTYIVTESGSMEAEAGCFDDCVMSLALANHVHEGAWEPVETPEGTIH